jgi:sugar lactone lactonase YvrE
MAIRGRIDVHRRNTRPVGPTAIMKEPLMSVTLAGLDRRRGMAARKTLVSTWRKLVLGVVGCAIAWASAVRASGQTADLELPRDARIGALELVATFDGPTPAGVAVSHHGRIFISFPRWGGAVDFTLAELKGGQAAAYPTAALNRPDKEHAADHFLSVQSVVVDAQDRLWALDTGLVDFQPVGAGGAKLVCVDLQQNRIVQTVHFPPEVVLPTTYLTDVRFHLGLGKGGTAFITDCAPGGATGIIVADLASGKSWRRLHDHPSTRAEKGFLAFAEGQPFLDRPAQGPPASVTIGADGIAISHDGKRLFYCALAGRRLFAVSTEALADQALSDTEVARTLQDLGEKGSSDGLETDAEGRLYATNYEQNAIHSRSPDGRWDTLAHDPRLLWPDTLCLARDGYLYVTTNQMHRQPRFHEGKDFRQKPYSLFRIRVDAHPVLLR